MTLLGCANPKLKLIEVKGVIEGQRESYWIDDQERKQNEYRRYDSTTLREVSTYLDDTLHGARTLYDAQGNKEIEEHYVRGVFNGAYHTFYPSGQQQLTGQYSEGVMSGVWIKYYESGQVMEEVTMRDNNENGPFVEYHPNGHLKAEGRYLNGDNEHGELKLYDENGNLDRKMMCEEGICRTIWEREKTDSDEAK